jgi:hypothetical protein
MGTGLLDREFILRTLTHDAPWCGSHGAEGAYLGMGLIYYGLVYARQARTAVCLGSGGGFVPRMMRQAQRDLAIADQARTILVDANRPSAGWGAPAWLGKDSFFRRSFGDIEVVMKTTQEAASKVFAAQNLTIDVLHIDADHSFEACLADFRSYRQFLRNGSIVTLHDTNWPPAGVRHVVEHLRTRSDCEVIDFPDIGVGTALVRIVEDEAAPATPVSRRHYGQENAAIEFTRKAESPALAPLQRGWSYLESEAFRSRGVLAAHFVRDCADVLEIGGGEASIDTFLTGPHRNVIVLDPYLRERRSDTLNGTPCAIWHVRARFQDVEWRINAPGEYGVVMLGLDLQDLDEGSRRTLYELIDKARVTVLEFPTSWTPSHEQYDLIRRNTRTCEQYTCKLDLAGNQLGNLGNSWPPRFDREMHVFAPLAQ